MTSPIANLSLEQWAKTLPASLMVYPDSFFDRLKYLVWSLYTPLHPFIRDILLAFGMNSQSDNYPQGRQPYVLGTTRRATDYHGTMQTPGVPDLLAFLPRRAPRYGWQFLVIECKGRGGRLRPDQVRFEELCRWAEIPHIVGGLDAVIAWLVAQGYVQAESFPHYRQQRSDA